MATNKRHIQIQKNEMGKFVAVIPNYFKNIGTTYSYLQRSVDASFQQSIFKKNAVINVIFNK